MCANDSYITAGHKIESKIGTVCTWCHSSELDHGTSKDQMQSWICRSLCVQMTATSQQATKLKARLGQYVPGVIVVNKTMAVHEIKVRLDL